VSTLKIILKKELLTAIRNLQIQLTAGIISILLLIAGVGGYLNYKTQKEQIAYAKEEKRQQWLKQGDKHPHIAAHYGTFVFKPKTGLSFFDFGLDAYTGSSIYLEAHYQHEFMFRPAQDYGAMIRFGELSIALVLQILIPLLIIFLCFSSFTQERENGTLKIIVSQGISFRMLAWGKITAYVILVFAILMPTLLILMAGIFTRPELVLSSDIFWRTLLILLSYSLYFFIFIGLSVWISSYSGVSGNALLTLLSVWILFTIIIPKTTANTAGNVFPLPSINSYHQEIKQYIESRIERDPLKDTLIVNFTNKLLRQYKVDSVAQLPINYEAACSQVYEDFTNSLHDKHSVELFNQFVRQNNVSTYASIFNPYLSIRNLSMALSATDFYTYADFQNEAEKYRRDLVRQMNFDYRDHSKTGEFYEYKADENLWRSVKDFKYEIPPVKSSMSKYSIEFLALAFWALMVSLLVTFWINKSAI
jgi:ABC-2 type transport system permease protein